MSTDTVADLMALADACMTLSRNIGEMHMLDEPGDEWALEQKLTAAREALRAALSEVLGDSQPVALPCIVDSWSSRVCQHGTKCCIVDHASPERAEPASVQALRIAARNLLEACLEAEAGEDLSCLIDGSLLDAVSAALAAHPSTDQS